jgi:hypothetical protein
MMGAGIVNDFGMGAQPTGLDLLTVWEREQELQLMTNKAFVDRDDQMVERVRLGPLWSRGLVVRVYFPVIKVSRFSLRFARTQFKFRSFGP